MWWEAFQHATMTPTSAGSWLWKAVTLGACQCQYPVNRYAQCDYRRVPSQETSGACPSSRTHPGENDADVFCAITRNSYEAVTAAAHKTPSGKAHPLDLARGRPRASRIRGLWRPGRDVSPMSETTTGTTELTSQYAAQVAGDLERNFKEQDRISGEIEALQAQLTALQQDQAVLVNIQQALGVPAAPAEPAVESATRRRRRPHVRRHRARSSRRRTRRPGSSAQSELVKRLAGAAPTSPTLVDLVREHLASQGEPRSAAEIATALGTAALRAHRQDNGRAHNTRRARGQESGPAQQAGQVRLLTSAPHAAAPAAPGEEPTAG